MESMMMNMSAAAAAASQGGVSASDGVAATTTKDGEVLTGTTIVAIPAKDGVVLAADTRVSAGIYVMARSSDKIAALTDHIFVLRSGSAADTQVLSDYVKYYLQQLIMVMGRKPRVKTAAHLLSNLYYNNKHYLSASLIVAGYDDVDGPSIYQIMQGGSCLKVPFAIGGSGSTYIYGMMDSLYSEQQKKQEEAGGIESDGVSWSTDEVKTIMYKLLSHGMARDGGSGGSVRTVTITSTGHERDYMPGNTLPFGPVAF